ncbi:unnamed protein product [Calicophoron daubneyi]|uniref:Uncharacterized protein n=1 Tax=Calicophoron daubneyi TaxID=300641 RepID=A0AAV2TFW0_CALDB
MNRLSQAISNTKAYAGEEISARLATAHETLTRLFRKIEEVVDKDPLPSSQSKSLRLHVQTTAVWLNTRINELGGELGSKASRPKERFVACVKEIEQVAQDLHEIFGWATGKQDESAATSLVLCESDREKFCCTLCNRCSLTKFEELKAVYQDLVYTKGRRLYLWVEAFGEPVCGDSTELGIIKKREATLFWILHIHISDILRRLDTVRKIHSVPRKYGAIDTIELCEQDIQGVLEVALFRIMALQQLETLEDAQSPFKSILREMTKSFKLLSELIHFHSWYYKQGIMDHQVCLTTFNLVSVRVLKGFVHVITQKLIPSGKINENCDPVHPQYNAYIRYKQVFGVDKEIPLSKQGGDNENTDPSNQSAETICLKFLEEWILKRAKDMGKLESELMIFQQQHNKLESPPPRIESKKIRLLLRMYDDRLIRRFAREIWELVGKLRSCATAFRILHDSLRTRRLEEKPKRLVPKRIIDFFEKDLDSFCGRMNEVKGLCKESHEKVVNDLSEIFNLNKYEVEMGREAEEQSTSQSAYSVGNPISEEEGLFYRYFIIYCRQCVDALIRAIEEAMGTSMTYRTHFLDTLHDEYRRSGLALFSALRPYIPREKVEKQMHLDSSFDESVLLTENGNAGCHGQKLFGLVQVLLEENNPEQQKAVEQYLCEIFDRNCFKMLDRFKFTRKNAALADVSKEFRKRIRLLLLSVLAYWQKKSFDELADMLDRFGSKVKYYACSGNLLAKFARSHFRSLTNDHEHNEQASATISKFFRTAAEERYEKWRIMKERLGDLKKADLRNVDEHLKPPLKEVFSEALSEAKNSVGDEGSTRQATQKDVETLLLDVLDENPELMRRRSSIDACLRAIIAKRPELMHNRLPVTQVLTRVSDLVTVNRPIHVDPLFFCLTEQESNAILLTNRENLKSKPKKLAERHKIRSPENPSVQVYIPRMKKYPDRIQLIIQNTAGLVDEVLWRLFDLISTDPRIDLGLYIQVKIYVCMLETTRRLGRIFLALTHGILKLINLVLLELNELEPDESYLFFKVLKNYIENYILPAFVEHSSSRREELSKSVEMEH